MAFPSNMGRKFRKQEEVYLAGTFKFFKHLNPDFTWDPDGKWVTGIYLVGPELDKFRSWQGRGIKNTLKQDDDGMWFTNISRKCSYETNGRKVGRQPPRVFQNIDGREVPVDVRVGNGSTGIAKCILWGSPSYPGLNLRWEAARIDSLVPYKAEEDFPDGGEMTKELRELPPEPLF